LKYHSNSTLHPFIRSQPAEKNRAPLFSGINSAEKQKGKKEGGLGEGIFALLRFRLERFRFSLIKRNTK